MVEASNKTSAEVSQPVIVRGSELDLNTDLSEVKLQGEVAQNIDVKFLPCAHFCSKSKSGAPVYSAEVYILTIY